MSILIKEMAMPETCDDCPFHVYHSHHEYVCKATPMLYPMNLANSKGIRKNWCPLVEVKTPHGDLIDRDELFIPALSSSHDNEMVCDIISDAPTVIEAEDE